MFNNSHVSDQDLLLAAEGELSKKRTSKIQKHLDGCPECRTQLKKLEDTGADFGRVYRESLSRPLSSSASSRALFTARLSQLASEPYRKTWWRAFGSVPVQGRFAYAFW